MKLLLSDISLPFAVLFLCIAAACLYIAKQQEAHVQALSGDGQVAAAQLVDKTTFTSSGIHKYAHFGDKGPTTYTLHYRFTLPETGEQREATSDVHPDVWNAVQVGQHYQIVYSPADPALTSLFNGQDFIDGARLAYRIAWSCLALGVICAGIYWRLKA
jgi:hypothetical protein